MEERGHKENLKKLIISMIDGEIDNFVSKKSLHKYLSGNLDNVIEKNIGKLNPHKLTYLQVLNSCSNQIKLNSISKIIRSEKLFKDKSELLKFANYLDIGINNRVSYNKTLKIVSNHIYRNKNSLSKRFISYKRGNNEYILEPKIIKEEILNDYQDKMKKDMESIAKMFEVEVCEDTTAEQIRQDIIKSIINSKLKNK